MKGLVTAPLCTLLSEPSAGAERADEALHGWPLEVLDTPAPGWRRVRTHYRYEGFVHEEDLLADDRAADRWAQSPKRVVLHKHFCDVQAGASVRAPNLLSLPRGAVLAVEGESEEGWQRVRLCTGESGFVRTSALGVHHSAPMPGGEEALRRALVEHAFRYQGVSYRWGGKTPQGIDCSGLTSMAYLLCGILIYRDAQIKAGFPIREIDRAALAPGDLLYFPGHIAMYMGGGAYIHATGAAGSDGVTVNSLDPKSPVFRKDLFDSITAAGSYF